jgi:eukaryotic-like serine/threonine-protein kinase
MMVAVAVDDHLGTAATASGARDSSPSIDVTPSLIAGRYTVLGLLGTGGMGRVYRVHDEKLDEVVALKMLRRELVDDETALERFRQEVKLARRVTSPHVVRTFDLGEHAGEHFLTMEYIEGRSLAQLLDERRLPVDEVLNVARAGCAGIAAAHAAGVMHRDLKPDNILVAKSGRIAITDFGIARTTDPNATGEGFIGTPAYMAPEQVEGLAAIGPPADVYAFGAILFEMLAGRRPFVGTDMYDVAVARLHAPPPDPRAFGDVPAPLAELVLRCLAIEPSARFADGSELATALIAIDPVPALVAPPRPSVPARTALAVAIAPLRAAGPLEDLADGLTEEIVDALTMTRGLRVLPLGSVRSAQGDVRDARELGRALDVDVMIEGSLKSRGSGVRISMRVVGVADGFQLWANHFDTTPEGMLFTSDTIAQAIARALTVEIKLPARSTSSARAIEHYLEGKAKLRSSWFTSGLDEALTQLEVAHSLAPDDSNILASLATCLARTDFLGAHGRLARARTLADRAAVLAPTSGEARIAVGLSNLYSGRVPDAAMAFCRAVSFAPGMALAHAHFGAILLEAGALDESLSHLEAAASLDPLQLADLPRAYIYAGRWDDGLSLLADARALTHFARSQIGRFKLWRRELAPVNLEEALRDAPGDFPLWATLVSKFHRTGQLPLEEREQYRSVVDVPNSRLRATRSQFYVEQLMYIGDHEAALTFVAMSVDAGLHDYLWIQRCPLLDPLRTDPRFEPLAAKVRTRVHCGQP